MLKQALNGLLAGALVYVTIFVTFYILFALRGGFFGSMAAGVFVIAFTVIANPLNPLYVPPGRWPGWNRRLLAKLFKDFVFGLFAGTTFLGITYFTSFAIVRVLSLAEPVRTSLTGLISGILLGFAGTMFYKIWFPSHKESGK